MTQEQRTGFPLSYTLRSALAGASTTMTLVPQAF